MNTDKLVCPMCGNEIQEAIDNNFFACREANCINANIVISKNQLPTLDEWVERQR